MSSTFETAHGVEARVSLLEKARTCSAKRRVHVCVGGRREGSREENPVEGRQMGDLTNGGGQVLSPSTPRQVLPQFREGPDMPFSPCVALSLSLAYTHTLFLFISPFSLPLSLTHTQKAIIIRNG